jgi:2-octaprenyl-6-methoxyphenol hydroxylase
LQIGIIGGGPVGSIAGLALKRKGHTVRLFDPTAQKPRMSLALSETTLSLLENIGVHLTAGQDLVEILVNEKGLPGSVLLNAPECGHLRFGRAICSHELDKTLTGQVADMLEPAAVTGVRARSTKVNPRIELETGETFEPDLVILADGGRSGLSDALGMDAQLRLFDRTALLGRIHVETPFSGRAYERFIGTGPLALLPIDPAVYGFVWSLAPRDADGLKQSTPALLDALCSALPPELGRVELVCDVVKIPLIERWIDQPYRPGIVLLGNGAQTIHPVAGQGLNLALRGLSRLVDALAMSDPDTAVSAAFMSWKSNRDFTRLASSSLEALFDRELLSRKLLTSIGMALSDQSPWLKRKIGEAGMGIIS